MECPVAVGAAPGQRQPEQSAQASRGKASLADCSQPERPVKLIDIVRKFPTEDHCRDHLEQIRWPNGVTCPRCGHDKIVRLKARRQFTCASKACRYRFSVTSGTIFHRSHVDLQKWFLAIALTTDMKKGTPSLQLHRELAVSKECAWHMAMRIREAMREDVSQSDLFRGIVQADEHYHGGDPRNNSSIKAKRGRGSSKQPIAGVYENSTGSIRTAVVPNASSVVLEQFLEKWVDLPNAELHTDEWRSYLRVGRRCNPHRVVNHGMSYVSSDGCHTNGLENAWSLFARSVMGSFHQISVKHLPRYLAEFDARFNARKENGAFFDRVLRQSVGRRLTMEALVAEPVE